MGVNYNGKYYVCKTSTKRNLQFTRIFIQKLIDNIPQESRVGRHGEEEIVHTGFQGVAETKFQAPESAQTGE